MKANKRVIIYGAVFAIFLSLFWLPVLLVYHRMGDLEESFEIVQINLIALNLQQRDCLEFFESKIIDTFIIPKPFKIQKLNYQQKENLPFKQYKKSLVLMIDAYELGYKRGFSEALCDSLIELYQTRTDSTRTKLYEIFRKKTEAAKQRFIKLIVER